MANVNDKECRDLMENLESKLDRSLGREIGQVRGTAQGALGCAQKKVSQGTFRWTLGIVIVAVIGALSVCYYLAFSATNGVHETKTEAAGTKAEVKQIKEHLHGFRAEQRTWNEKQEERLEEIKDLLQSR